eukprot:Nitzschia sp. Nitz4//scaffold138_size62050//10919//15553//NITZ4_006383-RA/size62050-processed-gene-0.44-mRNA-1//1//CDS//3329535752//4894//frame0
MTNPHNVDICVTCVSEKPPQLPLREELPSLGIEVVYNAHGLGAEASKQEQQRRLTEYEKTATKSKAGKSLFRKSQGKVGAPKVSSPHALSYSSYQRRLQHQKDEPSHDKYSHQEEPIYRSPLSPSSVEREMYDEPPVGNVQFPTQSAEDLAVQEARNVFANFPDFEDPPEETRDVLKSPIQHHGARGEQDERQPSSPPTQAYSKDQSQDESSLDYMSNDIDSVHSDGSQAEAVMKSLEKIALSSLSRQVSPVPKRTNTLQGSKEESSKPSDEGRPIPSRDSTLSSKSVKVSSRYNEQNAPMEFYDLTAISDEDTADRIQFEMSEESAGAEGTSSKDLSTLSSKKDPPESSGVHVVPSSTIHEQLPGLRLQIPEDDDGYGHIVLDLSDVVEEGGPGSPLVYSPSTRHTRTIHSPRRRYAETIEEHDELHEEEENREELADAIKRDDPMGVYAADDVYNSLRLHPFADETNQYEQKFTRDIGRDDLVYHSPRKSYSEDGSSRQTESRESYSDSRPVSDFFLPPARVSGLTNEVDSGVRSNQGHHGLPDDRQALSVTFSHDVEAHYYDDTFGPTKYTNIFGCTNNYVDDEGEVPSSSRGKNQETPTFVAHGKDAPLLELDFSENLTLHTLCAKEFPNRFAEGEPCLVKDLVDDVVELKSAVSELVRLHPEGCRQVDEEGDLPVHILSRQLMEWEAQWYQKVYEKARDDEEEKPGGGAGITTLYQTMSQLIDILLRPLEADEDSCRQPGSVGYLLPLHIAAIFTVSYDTLKAIMERCPEAACQKCNLGSIRTFIPNYSLPLELHNRLSTDFPKWEIEESDREPDQEIQWTQSTIDRSYGTTGGMRRSDLMFAFNPEIMPYRQEIPRIRRLESRIRSEASIVGEADDEEDIEMTYAARRLWEWMCTFEGKDSGDNYEDSVRRVVQTLSEKAVKYLASMPSSKGEPLITIALSKCVEAVQDRLDEIASTEVAVPMASLAFGYASGKRISFLRNWDEAISSRYCLRGRGFVGSLCRTIFNIMEISFPTNFVLLPYKLVKDEDGRLGLESAEAATVAMKFADCLMHLTDAEKVLHFLEKKSLRFNSTSLGVRVSQDWDRVEAETKEYVMKLLNLYAGQPAYMYLLDEYTGVPLVPERDDDDGTYPLVVSEATETIRKLLPLMISGMIVMRGEQALPVLAQVLLNENIRMVQGHWIEAAKDLVGYLYSPQTEWTSSFLQDLRPLRSKLVDFIERGVSADAPSSGSNGLSSEWVVEMSLLKMLVEMHDPEHTLSGLQARRAGLQVLWTVDSAFLDPNSKKHLFRLEFKSLSELKEQSEELEEQNLLRKSEKQENDSDSDEDSDYDDSDQSTSSNTSSSTFDLLYGPLSLQHQLGVMEYSNSGENSGSSESPELAGLLSYGEPQFVAEPPPITRRKLHYASMTEPISLLNFGEDDMDLDDVLQLRILLDEQEAKLDFLRDKVGDLQVAEMELLEQEDRLGEMLASVNNQKDFLNLGPTNMGISSARKLLMRICELEDRVSCGEVEVGQLRNDITCFGLEAALKKNELLPYDDDDL